MQATLITVRLFGRVAVAVDGTPLAGGAAQRRRLALLCLLCTPPLHPLSRERAVHYLWGDGGGAGRHLLAVAVHALRRALGRDAVLSGPAGLSLNSGRFRVDVLEFVHALRRGDMEQAVALYGGPFLEGFGGEALPEFARWLEVQRARFAAAHGRALQRLSTVRGSKPPHPGAPAPPLPACTLESPAGRLELRLLGPVALRDGAGRMIAPVLAQPKRLALLAYVASAPPGGLRSRDELVGVFWPQADEAHARDALTTALGFLRRKLGADVLVACGDELGIAPDRLWCDAAALLQALELGELEQAVQLYRGELMQGFHLGTRAAFEPWLEDERARLRDGATRAAWQLADRSDARGDVGVAALWACRAVALVPYDEAAVRRLLALLELSGDRAGALAAYAAFRQRLRRDFDLAPAQATLDLVARIRGAALPAEAGFPPVDPGGSGFPGPARLPRHSTGPRTTARLPAAGAPPAVTLAVLPFEGIAPGEDVGWLAAGLTEDVRARLAELGDLRVVSRTSVRRLAGRRELSARELAARLGVTAVLDGTVRHLDGQVRVVAQLVDPVADRYLWVGTYDRVLAAPLAVQGEIASKIAQALQAELGPGGAIAGRVRPANSGEARRLHVRGGFCIGRLTEEGLRKGIAHLTDAVREEPGFADAFAETALAYVLLAVGHGAGALYPLEGFTRARAAVARALELDPLLSSAHSVLGFLKMAAEFDWAGAEYECRKGLELNTQSALPRDLLALLLSAEGRFEEATREQRVALQIEPLAVLSSGDLACNLLRAGQQDEALREAERLLDLAPGYPMAHAMRGWALLLKGSAASALRELEAALDLSPGSTLFLGQLGQAYALVGDTERARAILRRMQALSRERYVSPGHVALVHAGLGEEVQAFQQLERACVERSGGIHAVAGSFFFTSLRPHPRFHALLTRIGLREAPSPAAGAGSIAPTPPRSPLTSAGTERTFTAGPRDQFPPRL